MRTSLLARVRLLYGTPRAVVPRRSSDFFAMAPETADRENALWRWNFELES
jgi:hypothetical protein